MKTGAVVLQPGEEQRVVQRALRALLISHGQVCKCAACAVATPILARIEDSLTTPVPRAAVDQGEKR